MSQLPTPEEAQTPLGFADQTSGTKTAGGANLDAAKLIVMSGGASECGGRTWEGPSVTSHWGQGTTATFTKANSPEEQSTSPVVVDYFIITSASVAVSRLNLLHFKIHLPHKRSWRHDMVNYRTGLISIGFVERE